MSELNWRYCWNGTEYYFPEQKGALSTGGDIQSWIKPMWLRPYSLADHDPHLWENDKKKFSALVGWFSSWPFWHHRQFRRWPLLTCPTQMRHAEGCTAWEYEGNRKQAPARCSYSYRCTIRHIGSGSHYHSSVSLLKRGKGDPALFQVSNSQLCDKYL